MMKKTISVFLAALFLIGSLIACGDAPKLGEATPTDVSDTPEPVVTTDQTHITIELSPQVPDPLHIRSRFTSMCSFFAIVLAAHYGNHQVAQQTAFAAYYSFGQRESAA